MKKTFILSAMAIALAAYTPEAQAQGFLKKLKEKVAEKLESTVNSAVDGVVGNAESDNSSSDNAEATAASNDEAAPKVNTSTDFKRGGTILFQDDLKNEKVGEFPSKWDLLDGRAEVKNFNGENVIEISDNGFITPLIKQKGEYLTEEFTIEYDFYYWTQTPKGMDVGVNDLKLVLMRGADRTTYDLYVGDTESNCVFYSVTPVCDSDTRNYHYRNTNNQEKKTDYEYRLTKGWHTMQISFNKRAFKMYIDGNRVANVPNMAKSGWFGFQVPFDYNNLTFIKNIVVAKGAVELYDRNAQDVSAVEKAMQETGKFVTNNILFETGKADLKPESMTEIKKVADYMLKNKTVRFEVQGHCDNQGSDKVNDPLSQKRAEAIVAALVSLGVDEWNLRAVGKGSHEPVADNNTEAGRAKNRRVEFIKR